jgi:AraC-like DNA-binding protein
MGMGIASVIGGGLAHCDPSWTRRHWVHETYAKIYVVVAGAAVYQNQADSSPLVPGTTYFFPPHQASRHSCAQSLDVYWMHISIEAPVLDLRLRALRTIRSWPTASYERWREVYTALAQWSPDLGLVQQLRQQAMLSETFAMLLAGEADPNEAPELDQLRRRFEPAVRFMDEQFLRNPSLAEVASRIALSPPHLHRGFRQAFQTTPHRYMLRRRMDVAQQLLAATALPVAEVAERAGYPDQFYFSRVFKRFFRVSPEAFRRSRLRGA